jgi:hypothetical protein
MVTKNNWERVADSGNERDKGPIYDYAPIEEIQIDTTVVLQQNIDELDLTAVIKAVNGIK